MSLVPLVARVVLPLDMERLVMLGMNRAQLGLVVALARRGGSATISELLPDLGMAPQTARVAFAALERQGYAVADREPGERERFRTIWSLDTTQLHADLRDLIAATALKEQGEPEKP